MKTSFVLQSRYEPMVAKLSDKQAGILFKAIFHYVAAHEKPESLNDSAVAMAFDFICQDLDYNAARYAEVCQKRKEAINKRWHGIEKNTNQYNPVHNEVDNEVVVEDENENINTLTAQPKAAQTQSAVSLKKPEKQPRQILTQFAQEVAKRFESAIQNPTQYAIWFKRNVRCLKDILEFCDYDTKLALQTISVCATRLEKAGLSGGYEAVCRNLPEYMVYAQRELEENSR